MTQVSRFLLTAFLVLVPGFVFAAVDATGNWQGQGSWSFQGAPAACQMQLAFKQTATEFKRTSGMFDCGVVALEAYELNLTIQDGKLLLGGQPVGSVSDTAIDWSEAYSPTVQIQTHIVIQDKKMDYQETWTNKGQVLYVIKGNLSL